MKTFPFISNYLINFLNSLLSTTFPNRLLLPVCTDRLAEVRTGGLGVVLDAGLLHCFVVGAAL